MRRERTPWSERIFDRLPALNFALLLLPVLLAGLELTSSLAIEATLPPPGDFAELDAPPAPRPASRPTPVALPSPAPIADADADPDRAPAAPLPFSDSPLGYGP